MKKILIFSLAYYPHVGGAEIAIKEITDRIKDIEFHMVTMRFLRSELSQEKIGNVIVHRVGGGRTYISKILFVPRATLRGLALHRAQHFHGLWAMMSYMLFPIMLMRIRGVRIPYVLSLQEGDPFRRVFERLIIRPVRPLLRAGFRKAQVIQTISTFLAAWPEQLGYRGPVVVIPNGVDVTHFSRETSPSNIADIATTLGKKEGDVYLITTSRLVGKNALDDVIRALALLPSHVHFLILGSGSEEGALRLLAKKLGVANRTKFLGHIKHFRIPKYLSISDIFVRPSRSEGMGNSLIEAMAARIPVVATHEGGISDFLFDSKRNPGQDATGWVVDTDSPQQIADAVRTILDNPEEAKRVTDNAYTLVSKNYSWDLVARDMREKVFARVLK